MARLLTALPGRNGVDVDRQMLLTTYWEALSRYDWISDAVWETAVRRLIAQCRWVPPIADIVTVCHDVDREMIRAAETQERAERESDAAMPSWLMSGAATRGAPRGLLGAIASGYWDRAAAHARVQTRLRRERLEERAKAAYDDAAATMTPEQVAARWKSLREQSEAAARKELGSWTSPEPSDEDIDRELGRMAGLRQGEAGCLRGPLKAALEFRLPRGWNDIPHQS